MIKRTLTAAAFLTAVTGASTSSGDYRVFKIADTSTQIPGAPAGQTFSGFDAPAASRNSIALGPETPATGFRATGPGGLIGVYRANPTFPMTQPGFALSRIADTTTAVPDSAATFTDFTRPTFFNSFTTGGIVFTGASPAGEGVYRSGFGGPLTRIPPANPNANAFSAPSGMFSTIAFTESAGALMRISVSDGTTTTGKDLGLFGPPSASHFLFPDPAGTQVIAYAARDDVGSPYSAIKTYFTPEGVPFVLASVGSPVPGGTGNFSGFGDPAAGHQSVFFRATGSGAQEGIYEIGVSGLPRFNRVDRNSQVPGRPGVTFTGFSDPAAYGNAFAFLAALSDGDTALYSNDLTELISTGDVIGGKTISALDISREAIGGALNADYVFKAEFTDGSEGIYMLKLPEPGTMTLALGAITLLAHRRRVGRASSIR